jgi:hypothetical protein
MAFSFHFHTSFQYPTPSNIPSIEAIFPGQRPSHHRGERGENFLRERSIDIYKTIYRSIMIYIIFSNHL